MSLSCDERSSVLKLCQGTHPRGQNLFHFSQRGVLWKTSLEAAAGAVAGLFKAIAQGQQDGHWFEILGTLRFRSIFLHFWYRIHDDTWDDTTDDNRSDDNRCCHSWSFFSTTDPKMINRETIITYNNHGLVSQLVTHMFGDYTS